jgi:hypothetical protein
LPTDEDVSYPYVTPRPALCEIRHRFGIYLAVLRRITDDNVGGEIDGKPAEQLP